jgi:hypothetical protein
LSSSGGSWPEAYDPSVIEAPVDAGWDDVVAAT